MSARAGLLCCPSCNGQLSTESHGFACPICDLEFADTETFPCLFLPNGWSPSRADVTEVIKQFYEENPFPNYEDFDSPASLVQKSRRNLFAKSLNEQIPFGVRVLDAGCGTGQLTNFLAIAEREVFGADMCINSLRLADGFRTKHQLTRAQFVQMNLFRPAFEDSVFDIVISNGVLHHTSDPEAALQRLSRLVRPDGYFVLGLYHRYGRLATDVRRMIFKVKKDRFRGLDRRAVSKELSTLRQNTWFADQYENPHESKHTVGQVLGWFERAGLEYVSAIPSTVPFQVFDEGSKLFERTRLGTRPERALVNIGSALRGHREGGFFVLIGQRA